MKHSAHYTLQIVHKKEEDNEEDEVSSPLHSSTSSQYLFVLARQIEIVEYTPKKEEFDQEEDGIVIVAPNDVHVAVSRLLGDHCFSDCWQVGLSNPLKRKKEEDSDDEVKVPYQDTFVPAR